MFKNFISFIMCVLLIIGGSAFSITVQAQQISSAQAEAKVRLTQFQNLKKDMDAVAAQIKQASTESEKLENRDRVYNFIIPASAVTAIVALSGLGVEYVAWWVVNAGYETTSSKFINGNRILKRLFFADLAVVGVSFIAAGYFEYKVNANEQQIRELGNKIANLEGQLDQSIVIDQAIVSN